MPCSVGWKGSVSMSSKRPAVRVENLGKRYLIPKKRNPSSMTAHLKDFIPFLRDKSEDYFWALKDVSFEVQPGEILGILGKNGSGKSTLLKIRSNVTFPTEGRAELLGRVGSLLEVGTGFHPDLTGRENVFMAGSLLGLPQREIRKKFDEIVDFSGIEKFIDVPVKRYSSGMYVRLAFSTTSLLRCDILILDEVMAVGDAEFRFKCQNNVKKIANEGGVIIVVSHNIFAIRNMCKTGLLLENGKKTTFGPIAEVASEYLLLTNKKLTFESEILPFKNISEMSGFEGPRPTKILLWIETLNMHHGPSTQFSTGDSLEIRVGFRVPKNFSKVPFYLSVFFLDEEANRVMMVHSLHDQSLPEIYGSGVLKCTIPNLILVEGSYSVMLDFGTCGIVNTSLDCVPCATQVKVTLKDYLGKQGLRPNQGFFAQRSCWELENDIQ